MSCKIRLDAKFYPQVLDCGQSAKSRSLVAWFLPVEEAGGMAGTIVSKRTFHDAADRNRAKRLLREAFRLERNKLRGDVAWVLIGRRGIAGKKCSDVRRDLLYVASKNNLLAK